MIQNVSLKQNYNPTFKQAFKKPEINEKIRNNKQLKFVDSFVKQSAKSAPALFGLTYLWSYMDMKTKGIQIKDTLKTNVKNFFVPALVASSLIIAAIDTKQKNKE